MAYIYAHIHCAPMLLWLAEAAGLASVAETYTRLSERTCTEEAFKRIVVVLIPEPKKPRDIEQNSGLRRAWEKRIDEVQAARTKISELRKTGRGMDLEGSTGTLWGTLNAVLEYVDHHR
jgi:hypothetical protein